MEDVKNGLTNIPDFPPSVMFAKQVALSSIKIIDEYPGKRR
jgi:hypothetical protein